MEVLCYDILRISHQDYARQVPKLRTNWSTSPRPDVPCISFNRNQYSKKIKTNEKESSSSLGEISEGRNGNHLSSHRARTMSHDSSWRCPNSQPALLSKGFLPLFFGLVFLIFYTAHESGKFVIVIHGVERGRDGGEKREKPTGL